MITRKEMTRMLLKEGLLSCLENHSFESLTVTLLCKASGITRSTFYLHYSNIMEIVDDLVDDAIAYSRPGMVDDNNLQTIARTLSAASDSVSLREAYEDRQGLVVAKALGTSFDVGISVFVFLVHGLYAVNKQYKWSQSDEWLEAQKVIFELVYRGLQRK